MLKKIICMLVALVFIVACVPVAAADTDQQAIYKSQITVTKDGGNYQVGFVNIEFKKDFLDPQMLPATFDVTICAENGVPEIVFSPDTPTFYKFVHIRVDSYSGPLYDTVRGENIKVDIEKQQIKATHFSRYAFL